MAAWTRSLTIRAWCIPTKTRDFARGTRIFARECEESALIAAWENFRLDVCRHATFASLIFSREFHASKCKIYKLFDQFEKKKKQRSGIEFLRIFFTIFKLKCHLKIISGKCSPHFAFCVYLRLRLRRRIAFRYYYIQSTLASSLHEGRLPSSRLPLLYVTINFVFSRCYPDVSFALSLFAAALRSLVRPPRAPVKSLTFFLPYEPEEETRRRNVTTARSFQVFYGFVLPRLRILSCPRSFFFSAHIPIPLHLAKWMAKNVHAKLIWHLFSPSRLCRISASLFVSAKSSRYRTWTLRYVTPVDFIKRNWNRGERYDRYNLLSFFDDKKICYRLSFI